jgi:hypothetical protein
MMAHEVQSFIERWSNPGYAAAVMGADAVDIPLAIF